jgi:hypothetical protein
MLMLQRTRQFMAANCLDGERSAGQLLEEPFLDDVTVTISAVTATPIPAALPLFATGLGTLGLLGWRRRRKAQVIA